MGHHQADKQRYTHTNARTHTYTHKHAHVKYTERFRMEEAKETVRMFEDGRVHCNMRKHITREA